MSRLIKHFTTNKLPNRWFKKGERFIQVTPEYKQGDGTWIFLYEFIENGTRRGCCIVGFNLYDDMTEIAEQEWLNALSECQN